MKNRRSFEVAHIDAQGDIWGGMAYEFLWQSMAGVSATVYGENYTIRREVGGKMMDVPYGGWAIIESPNPAQQSSDDSRNDDPRTTQLARIKWQEGPVDRAADQYPDGIFVEDLLGLAHERLEFYENSSFACEENAQAIQHIKAAIKILLSRRKDRQARGVEGRNEA